MLGVKYNRHSVQQNLSINKNKMSLGNMTDIATKQSVQ